MIITIKDNSIKSVCQIDNGNLIIYTDKAFLIYSIGKDTYKCEGIIKIKDNSHNTVTHLENNMIATYHYEIYLWNMNDKPYSDKPFKVLNGHEAGIVDILYIKNQKKLISLDFPGCFVIWDFTTFQSIMKITFSTIEEIENEEGIYTNTLLQLNEDTIVVGGEEHIFFVNIQTGLFRKKELCCGIGKTIEVKSIIKLRDNKSILCAEQCKLGYFLLYNTESDSFIRIKTTHTFWVEQLLKLNENTFVSSGTDEFLRIWKY